MDETSTAPAPLPGRKEVAEFLGMTVAALAHMHHRGDGPPYSRIGKSARYRWEDVHRWVNDRITDATAARSA